MRITIVKSSMGGTAMNNLDELVTFEKRYAEAWCSQNSESVAAFFAESGSLSVNDGPPAGIFPT